MHILKESIQDAYTKIWWHCIEDKSKETKKRPSIWTEILISFSFFPSTSASAKQNACQSQLSHTCYRPEVPSEQDNMNDPDWKSVSTSLNHYTERGWSSVQFPQPY